MIQVVSGVLLVFGFCLILFLVFLSQRQKLGGQQGSYKQPKSKRSLQLRKSPKRMF